jgi:hypothetical protein
MASASALPLVVWLQSFNIHDPCLRTKTEVSRRSKSATAAISAWNYRSPLDSFASSIWFYTCPSNNIYTSLAANMCRPSGLMLPTDPPRPGTGASPSHACICLASSITRTEVLSYAQPRCSLPCIRCLMNLIRHQITPLGLRSRGATPAYTHGGLFVPRKLL